MERKNRDITREGLHSYINTELDSQTQNDADPAWGESPCYLFNEEKYNELKHSIDTWRKQNYYHVVPNSGFWVNLDMMISYFIQVPELDRQEILTYLYNTQSQGYELVIRQEEVTNLAIKDLDNL